MDEWFDGSVLNVAGAPPGDCAVGHLAEGTWSAGQVRSGRVLCYQKRGASSIEWTDERFLVLGHASRDDLGDLELLRWWLVEAGPWLQEGERRDADAPIDPLPEGTFRRRVTQEDFEELQALTGGVLHSWIGTWTLRVGDGEYQVNSPDPVFDDRGFYVYGKEGNVAIYTTNEPACEGDPEVVTWSIQDGLLDLSRAVHAPDCGGIQTDPPPWELHSWRQVA
jgi:hypothetical protein